MTRKQERIRRCLQWLAIVGLGTLSGAIGLASIDSWAGIAMVVIGPVGGLVLGHLRMILPPGTAVLTYHSVSPKPDWLPWADEIAVHPDTLARHLDTLAAMQCAIVSTRDYVAARQGGTHLPDAPVLLHFDDGYLDNFVHAVPALVKRGMPATFFASLDFIEPGDAVRNTPTDEAGYMTWAELREIERYDGLEVEPHGVDHGRVPVSARTVDVLTPANWRRHAWVQWAATPGPKYDWFRQDSPRAVPIGSPVPESDLAFAARAWAGNGCEDQRTFERRVTTHLESCRDAFETHLGRTPEIFCWPENKVSADVRQIAAALGYRATTGGNQRNAASEPATTISRIHMGDRALGVRWTAAEGFHLRAAVRLAQGNLYWYAAVGPMNLIRAIVMRARRFGASE